MPKVELAQAYVTVIPSMKDAQETITSGLNDVLGEKAAAPLGDKFGGGLSAAIGAKLSKFAAPAAVGAMAVGLAKGAFDVGKAYDEMYDSIRVGTGATGAAFDDLKKSAKNVLSDVPADAATVGTYLADVNTRTGLTGEALEGLSRQFVELEEIGSKMDVNKATGMMTAWGVSSEDMSGKLDELFIVSQNTGIGMDALAGAMSANATTMKSLGFSFEDTATMAGLLDKAGLNASGMMAKMSKAAVKLAKDGEEPADAYNRVVKEMGGFIKAGDKASAMKLATDLFGTRGAPQFIQALETGALDIDQMSASLKSSSGAIGQNAKDTRSAAENFDILKNNVLNLLEPLGSGVFGAAGDAIGAMIPVAKGAGQMLDGMFKTVSKSKTAQSLLKAMSSTVKAMGPLARASFGALSAALKPLKPVVSALASVLAGRLKNALNAVKSGIEGATKVMKFFKNLFSGRISFPHISLPHITISPSGWKPGDLLKGSVPHLGVKFYAKGGIMKNVTPFAMFGGNVHVGGERGDEAIVPLRGNEARPFARLIANEIGGGNITVNIAYNAGEDAEALARDFVNAVNRCRRMGVAYGS